MGPDIVMVVAINFIDSLLVPLTSKFSVKTKINS